MPLSEIDIEIHEAFNEFDDKNEAVIKNDIAEYMNEKGFLSYTEKVTMNETFCRLSYDGIKMKKSGYAMSIVKDEIVNAPNVITGIPFIPVQDFNSERYNDMLIEESYIAAKGESHAYLPVQLKNVMLLEGLILKPNDNKPNENNEILVVLSPKGLEVQYEGWQNYKERIRVEQILNQKNNQQNSIRKITSNLKNFQLDNEDKTTNFLSDIYGIDFEKNKKIEKKNWFQENSKELILLIIGLVLTMIVHWFGLI